jgi:hypothetical protein
MRMPFALACLGLCCVLSPTVAHAEMPRFFELEGFSRFLDSNPETTAITEEGAIALPPGIKDRFSDAAAAFGNACAQGDRVIVSRVEDGEVLAIDAKGRTQPLYKVEEAMVTALLCDAEAIYIAAAGPAARVYRIDKKGRVDTFVRPAAAYVWDMVHGPNGTVYMATGEPGAVLAVDSAGKAKAVFTAEQAHLKSLAYDPRLGLFVGGGERGVVYGARDSKTFRALYDTGTAEITALTARGNYLFAAGVTGSAALVAGDTPENTAQGAAAPVKKGKGGEVRSQLVRIGLDGTADILAGSADEAVFALAFDAQGQVIVATGATGRDDPRGRLYSLDPENKRIAMLYQSPSRRLTHLVRLPNQDLAAVANGGARVVEVTGERARSGSFLTLPFDTGINSRFGLVQILGTFAKGTGATVAVRTGQTAEPDATWSPWTGEVDAPGNRPFHVPPGRFLQARLILRGDGKNTPHVHRLRIAYLRQNVAPFVRDVTVLRKGLALYSVPRDDSKQKLVAVADKADDQTTPETPTPHPAPRARQVQDPGMLTVKWQSDDPNGDDLTFALDVRQAESSVWQSLKADLDEPFFTFRSSQLADGYYYFRVQASDARSNPDGMDKVDVRDSRAVLIDNTPPHLEALKVATSKREVRITGSVEDVFGPLMELTYALDGQAPRPMAPEDGLLDGPKEKFTIRLTNLATGAHSVTVRCKDEAENEAVVAAQFEMP